MVFTGDSKRYVLVLGRAEIRGAVIMSNKQFKSLELMIMVIGFTGMIAGMITNNTLFFMSCSIFFSFGCLLSVLDQNGVNRNE